MQGAPAGPFRIACLAILFALAACQKPLATSAPPLPGTTYAWVTFDASGVIESGAEGLADRARGRALTVNDPVRIASVSKLVVALGVLRLVERGRVDLDRDVSDYLGWSLRNPAFPDVPITLRTLLSHRSSLQDAGEAYVIPLGRTLRDAIGLDVFDREHKPGSFFRYSNLNFPVVATALERATGERFDRLMQREVIAPLALEACFNWTTCGSGAIGRAVVLHAPDGAVLRDDLGGRPPPCPVAITGTACDLDGYEIGTNGAIFSPQGGLRISAADLARIGQLLLNRGRYRGRAFLSAASMDELERNAWSFDGANGDTSGGFYCGYGLALQILPVRTHGCRDDLFATGRHAIGHAGDAYGVRSGLWVDPERRVGIVYFAANNGPEPPAGRSAYRPIEEWLAGKLP
jgi:CubicO group peptidase (beta-lactamase class C family)